MIKKYLFGLFVLSLLLISGISVEAKWFDISLFLKRYDPDKSICTLYATKKGTDLNDFELNGLGNILYNEGLIRCNGYRAKTQCEMGNQSWTDNLFISKKDKFKFEKNINYFELDDDTICREKTPRELKVEYCSGL